MSTPCPYCGAVDKPALEHSRNCRLRVTFFGGDYDWDRTEVQYKDGVAYRWDVTMGTWYPEGAP